MEWRDTGIVLGVRRHGETSAILEVMTEQHGRHLGLVRGGRSRTLQPVLQAGNQVAVGWRARLEDHLGQFTVEPVKYHAARLMETALGLSAIQLLAAHLRLLPERESDAGLYRAIVEIIGHLDDPQTTGEFLVHFELVILEKLGFGLDLERCALTGAREGLAFVSPKTGRACTRIAGEPWADSLMTLPAFLSPGANAVADLEALRQGLDLTRHFLARNVWQARGEQEPAARAAFISALARRLA